MGRRRNPVAHRICWESRSKTASGFKKGDTVQVTGSITSREYVKDDEKRRVWEIQVDDTAKIAPSAVSDAAEPETQTGPDEEIPFN
jgi:single-stranded DNA-binding protein